MKNKSLILVTLLFSTLCPLHGMEQNTRELHQALQKKYLESRIIKSQQSNDYTIKLVTGNAVEQFLPFVSLFLPFEMQKKYCSFVKSICYFVNVPKIQSLKLH